MMGKKFALIHYNGICSCNKIKAHGHNCETTPSLLLELTGHPEGQYHLNTAFGIESLPCVAVELWLVRLW